MKYRKYPLKEDYFDLLDEKSAYILGFIMADGNIYQNSLRIELSAKDIEVLNFIRNEISPNSSYSYRTLNDRQYVRLSINSKRLCQKLHEYGVIPNKATRIQIPHINDVLFPHLLRGLFDGDGYVYYRRNSIASGICFASPVIIYQIHKKLGYGNIRARSRKCILYSLDFGKNDTLQLRDYMYKDDAFSLKRKKDKMYGDFYTRHSRFWTKHQTEFLIHNHNLPHKELAIFLNKTTRSINCKLVRLKKLGKFNDRTIGNTNT